MPCVINLVLLLSKKKKKEDRKGIDKDTNWKADFLFSHFFFFWEYIKNVLIFIFFHRNVLHVTATLVECSHCSENNLATLMSTVILPLGFIIFSSLKHSSWLCVLAAIQSRIYNTLNRYETTRLLPNIQLIRLIT